MLFLKLSMTRSGRLNPIQTGGGGAESACADLSAYNFLKIQLNAAKLCESGNNLVG